MKEINLKVMSACAGGYREAADKWVEKCNEIHSKNGPYPSDQWIKITPESILATATFILSKNALSLASMLVSFNGNEFIDCTGSKDYAERQEAFKCFDNPDNYG